MYFFHFVAVCCYSGFPMVRLRFIHSFFFVLFCVYGVVVVLVGVDVGVVIAVFFFLFVVTGVLLPCCCLLLAAVFVLAAALSLLSACHYH
jgi:hypothetical protein